MLNTSRPIYPVERRSQPDRRSPWARLSGMFKYGRRRRLRRIEDRRKFVLLDHYPKALLVAAATILMLSLGDAFLTIILIEHGAVELNPIMDHLLKAGTLYFIMFKYGFTAASVSIVLLLNHYPLSGLNIPVRSFLSVFTVLFSAVIAWQLYLITRFVM